MISADTLLDFVASLGILGMLAIAYGLVRRRLPGRILAPPLAGCLFGLVAVIQMHSPFTPVDGLIVDMRNVPIALAGAFLGVRGLVTCLCIAAATRLQIGGVGAAAGVAGMILAGGAGVTWHAMTARGRRGAGAMIGLAVLMSCHLLAVVLLPRDLAVWFLTQAGPVILGLNFVAVPIVALLLERERCQMAEEARLRAVAAFGAGEGFMPPEALAWALAQSAASGSLMGRVVCIGLRLRHRGLLSRLWGAEAESIALRTMRTRLDALAPAGTVIGRAGGDLVLLALPAMSEEAVDALLARIRREVSETPVRVAGMAPLRLTLDMVVERHDALPDLAGIVAAFGLPSSRPLPARPAPVMSRAESPGSGGSDTLFRTFDRLRELRFGDG